MRRRTTRGSSGRRSRRCSAPRARSSPAGRPSCRRPELRERGEGRGEGQAGGASGVAGESRAAGGGCSAGEGSCPCSSVSQGRWWRGGTSWASAEVEAGRGGQVPIARRRAAVDARDDWLLRLLCDGAGRGRAEQGHVQRTRKRSPLLPSPTPARGLEEPGPVRESAHHSARSSCS